MGLNGYGIDKIPLLGGKEGLENFGGQNGILRPAQWIFVHMVHIFYRGKGVKPQVRKDKMSVIKGAGVIMYNMGAKSQLL